MVRRMSRDCRSSVPNTSPPLALGQFASCTTSHVSAARIPAVRSTANVTPATSRSAATTANRSTSASSTATPAGPASPSVRAHHCIVATSPNRPPSRSSTTWPRATAFARPGASSASIATPLSAWHAPPEFMPTTLMRSSWLFPPRTREVQFDEKWSFVAKKEKHCDPNEPADRHQGDNWDHVAFDPEHRLVVSVVPGKRTEDKTHQLVQDFRERTGGRLMNLMTSDEYSAYKAAIFEAYAVAQE